MSDDRIFTLPDEVVEESKKYFSALVLQNAMKFIRQSRVSISFKKGTLDTYYIASGIVKDDRTHECKISFKSRLVGTDENPLATNCDCNLWSADKHCPHSAALFITYHLQTWLENNAEGIEGSEAPPIAFAGGLGVNVQEYGTLILSPNQLVGAPAGSTYSGLQYLLHHKKIVPFPLPQSFHGKLILYFNEQDTLRFKYKTIDDEIHYEVSVFENLYLFNWKTGKAYHLPQDLKQLIARIRGNQFLLSINELLQSILELNLTEYVSIYVDQDDIFNLPKIYPKSRVSLTPGDKKSLLDFKLEFYDETERLLEAPEFLTQLTFGQGSLTSFRKKNEAYDFLNGLIETIKNNSDHYKKYLLTTSKRLKLIQLIDFFMRNEETIIFDQGLKSLIIYNNHFLKSFLTNLYDKFSEQVFRFAYYEHELKDLSYKLAPQQLFEGLQEFNRFAEQNGLPIFYDRQEISRWNSRIKFERRSSTTKWFDLELSMSEEDWTIIKEADIDTGLVLTKKGLILLNSDQRDLVRLMQKYTKYEGTEKDQSSQDLEDRLKRFVLPFNKARIFELFELKKIGIDGALTEEELKLCERLATLKELPKYDMPTELTATLRPYQETGYHWLRFLHESKLGACLADDMGLGKTLQTIAFLQSIYSDLTRVLIVCPVTILLNWENEIKKFSNMKHYIYHGGSREFPEDTKIILTSYGVMKRETEEIFSQHHFDVLILDEVQHLKNIRSLGAFSARKINADFRICLTGTPVENDLSEFYNILDLSIPGIWGDLQFVRTTSNTKSRMIARKTASPFILRRTKAQVLHDLPPKIENNQFIEFTPEEKKFYENNMLNIKKRISLAQSTAKYGEILRGLLQLRQNCLWQQRSEQLNYKQINSSKIEFLLETLESILEEGHQAIIFSQFTTYLDIIQYHIREKHWKFSRIDGTQSINKRQEQVDLFQKGENPVFLISLKAGGVGLNLTAASFVFIMDPWWNPAVEQQAIDRAHRIGQQNTLTVYRPIIKGSVEEKVLLLQEQKKQLFQDLLASDNDEVFSGKLSMKDFEMILS